VPGWFTDFAVAVAGTQLTERGNIQLVDRVNVRDFAQYFAARDSEDFYQRVARSFLETRASLARPSR
jgi:hypothetical protein